MAKDDYFYVVYHILRYLYDCLKASRPVEREKLGPVTSKFAIPQTYWEYVLKNMKQDGLIDGLSIYQADDEINVAFLEQTEITPKGIEYLLENGMMQKVKDALKTVKEIVPGI